MLLHFKKCTLLDIDLLITISKDTFVTAFEKDNNPGDFKAYIDIAFEKENLLLQLKNKHAAFYFVYKADILVGYFKLNEGAAQTDMNSLDAMELERIYVLQQFQGQQFGRLILQKVIELATEQRKAYLWLGVWEHNTNAIRFYKKHGFSKFDTHPYFIGEDEQTDWLLRYDLINFQSL